MANLSEHFKIDESALHEEWLKQPALMWTYSKKQAKARIALQTAKNHLDAETARVSAMIRQDPTKYNLKSSPTEGAIRDKVILHSRHIEATRAVLDAQHHYDIMGAAVNALDTKRKALENLVDLHAQGYFAAPRIKWRQNEQKNAALSRSANEIRPVRRKIGEPRDA